MLVDIACMGRAALRTSQLGLPLCRVSIAMGRASCLRSRGESGLRAAQIFSDAREHTCFFDTHEG